MGLDITYYKNLTKIDCVFNADGEPIHPVTREPLEDYYQASVNPDFPGRADEIENDAVYVCGDGDGFRAGSYGGYNQWREQLARLAGYPATPRERHGVTEARYDAGAWEATSGAFWELINFSDCEGVIGAKVAAKLAKDFAEYQEKADACEDSYFREKYAEWRKAFETAAQNGAVDFH